jgi:hypothetical protein
MKREKRIRRRKKNFLPTYFILTGARFLEMKG